MKNLILTAIRGTIQIIGLAIMLIALSLTRDRHSELVTDFFVKYMFLDRATWEEATKEPTHE